jgi:hypothetical protein
VPGCGTSQQKMDCYQYPVHQMHIISIAVPSAGTRF